MGKSIATTTLADNPASQPLGKTSITPVHGLENPAMREMWSGEICNVCGTQLYLDPSPAELEIWLHAWKYGGRYVSEGAHGEETTWEYKSEVPEWAREDWHGSSSTTICKRQDSPNTQETEI